MHYLIAKMFRFPKRSRSLLFNIFNASSFEIITWKYSRPNHIYKSKLIIVTKLIKSPNNATIRSFQNLYHIYNGGVDVYFPLLYMIEVVKDEAKKTCKSTARENHNFWLRCFFFELRRYQVFKKAEHVWAQWIVSKHIHNYIPT